MPDVSNTTTWDLTRKLEAGMLLLRLESWHAHLVAGCQPPTMDAAEAVGEYRTFEQAPALHDTDIARCLFALALPVHLRNGAC